jgi:Skp family chaperone for outer membrane proteins
MRLSFVAAALLLALLGSLAAALPAAAVDIRTKVAVIDIDRVRRTAAAMKSIQTQVGSYVSAYRAETEKEEQEIRSTQEELARKRTGLSPEAFNDEKRRLEERLAGAQGRVQQRRQSLDRVTSAAMQQVQDTLAQIVAEIAAERQLVLILRKDDVVYFANELEITDEVLGRLDQRLPTVRIQDPEG